MTGKQKNSVEVLKKIAEVTGLNIVMYDSKVVDDTYVEENGRYENNTVFIDINAGLTKVNDAQTKNAIIGTAAHEITHFIKEWSPEKYQMLEAFLLEEFGKYGDVNGAIKAKQKSLGLDSEAIAREELVAECCESMLSDPEGIRKLAMRDMTLAKKIAQWLNDYVSKLKNAVSEMDIHSETGKFLMQNSTEMQKIRELWYDALADATDNFNGRSDASGTDNASQQENKKASTEDGEARYSKREKDNKPSYNEWDVQAALYDALDHDDKGYDRLIKVGTMPKYITDKLGIEGDFYIYRNHIYENMVSKEQAIEDIRHTEGNHYHDLGFETIEAAIMALENPILSIASKTDKNNPAAIMILPVTGKNGVPLYSVMSFYSQMSINGDFSTKPHVVLSIYERDMVKPKEDKANKKSRDKSLEEIISEAVREGKVFDFDKKKRDALSVIAEQARLGNITETSLKESLTQFRKEIKTFKEKNNINYSKRVSKEESARSIIANTLESVATTDAERDILARYKEKLSTIEKKEAELKEKRAELNELRYTKGKRTPEMKAKMSSLASEVAKLENSIRAFDGRLLKMENTQFLRDLVSSHRKNTISDRLLKLEIVLK